MIELQPLNDSDLKLQLHNKMYWEKNLLNFDLPLLDSKTELTPEIKRHIFKNNVDIVNLELSSYCNRRCIYCPVSNFRRDYRDCIDEKMFDSILGDLLSIQYDRVLSLNLYNEPLDDIEFFLESLSRIRSNLPNTLIFTNTNGDNLTRELLNDLQDAGLNRLKVTIHPPADKPWDFDREKSRLLSLLNKIGAQSIPIEENASNLRSLMKLGQLQIVFQSVNWMVEGNSRGETVISQNLLTQRVQPCVKPFREFTIFHDGSITQCCDAFYDIKYRANRLGGVSLEKNIFDLYSSSNLRKIRTELFGWGPKSQICATCPVGDLSAISDSELRKNVLENLELSQI